MHRSARDSGAYAPICTILHHLVKIECILLDFVQILKIFEVIEAIRVTKLLIYNITSLITITETRFIFFSSCFREIVANFVDFRPVCPRFLSKYAPNIPGAEMVQNGA